MVATKIEQEPIDILVTQKWLRESGVDQCVIGTKKSGADTPPELRDEASKLSALLLGRLKDHGIYYEAQVEALSLHGELNEVLQCLGVSHAIVEMFDKKVAEDRKTKPLRSFLKSLAGQLRSMEALCVNYGLAAALILTMTFANFGAMSHENWVSYMTRIELPNPKCQKHAQEACDKSVQDPNLLYDYTRPTYCLKALNMLIADPALNLSATEHKCCITTIKCAVDASWQIEMAFTFGNGGATALLLVVVLLTSWLYISLNSSKANTSRWTEAKELSKGLAKWFLLLHTLFIVGLVAAYFGMFAVMAAKVTTYGLSWAVTMILICSFVMLSVILILVLYQIHTINKKVDHQRKGASFSGESILRTSSGDDHVTEYTYN